MTCAVQAQVSGKQCDLQIEPSVGIQSLANFQVNTCSPCLLHKSLESNAKYTQLQHSYHPDISHKHSDQCRKLGIYLIGGNLAPLSSLLINLGPQITQVGLGTAWKHREMHALWIVHC